MQMHLPLNLLQKQNTKYFDQPSINQLKGYNSGNLTSDI